MDVIENVLKSYLLYLETRSDKESIEEFRHIMTTTEELRRQELYYYIMQREDLFKENLFSSEIMDRTAFYAGALYKPIITPNRSHEINQFSLKMSNIDSSKIQDRIKEFEHQQMERKSSFKYDMNTGAPSEEREIDISKAIAGFMNASGGILFIGVNKDGNASGLDSDYTFVKDNNQDGFELELRNSIRKYLKITDDLYRMRFHKISETDICEVMVRPSVMPVLLYYKGKILFFVRQGNSTQPLGLADTLHHCQRYFWSYNIQI